MFACLHASRVDLLRVGRFERRRFLSGTVIGSARALAWKE
jgi:hypothetical protein